MAKISMTHRHSLPMEIARERVNQIFETYRERFKATRTWRGDTLYLSGNGFDAQAALGPAKVDIEVRLSYTASLFKPVIEIGLQEELEKRFKQ